MIVTIIILVPLCVRPTEYVDDCFEIPMDHSTIYNSASGMQLAKIPRRLLNLHTTVKETHTSDTIRYKEREKNPTVPMKGTE